MTTQQVLMLDCREEESMEIIQKVLHKITPLSKFKGDVPLEMVEKLIHKMVKKYFVRIQWITHTSIPYRLDEDEQWWSISLKQDDTHAWLGSISGYTMYEVLAKTAIKIYAMVKKGELEVRPQSWFDEREERAKQYRKEKEK